MVSEAIRLPRPLARRSVDFHIVDLALTWEDCAAFCNWLSDQEELPRVYELQANGSWNTVRNKGYRLPTEAEWEFACRAGSTTQYSFGEGSGQLDDFAWHSRNYAKNANGIVGLKRPNAFGLFDMHGHVNEWCSDFFDLKTYSNSPVADPLGASSGTTRVIRGGNTASTTLESLRSASRGGGHHDMRYHNYGFRIVRELAVHQRRRASRRSRQSPPPFPPSRSRTSTLLSSRRGSKKFRRCLRRSR